MDSKTPIAAGLAAVVGILVGTMIAPSGPDQEEIAAMVQEEAAKSLRPAEEMTTSLSERLDALTSELGKLAPLAGDVSGLNERFAGLDEGMRALSEETNQMAPAAALKALEEKLGEFASQQTTGAGDTAKTEIAALKEELSALRASMPQSGASSAGETSTRPGAPGAGHGPGETLLLADGELRVFVSRVAEEQQQARLSVQGDLMQLSVGETMLTLAGRDYCKITLDSITGKKAQISGACGDDLPQPEGAGVGETVMLNDGALRVFVSRAEDWPARARLWINGEKTSLSAGRTAFVAFEDDICGVTLNGVDRGHVILAAACGEELASTEAVGPGSSTSLGDGAARVFVSAVRDDGTVRVSVSGVEGLQTLKGGEAVELSDGCNVTVEAVTAGKAIFGYNCES